MQAAIPRCPLKKYAKEKTTCTEEQREGRDSLPRLRQKGETHGHA